MNRWKEILCLVVLFLSCGCYKRIVPPEQLQAARAVTVISALPGEISIDHVGFTIFTNSANVQPYPKLHLGSHLQQLALEKLKSEGSIPVVKSLASAQSYYQTYQDSSGFFDGEYASSLLKPAQLAARAVGADLYVLMLPYYGRPCPHAGSRSCENYGATGYGLWDSTNTLGIGPDTIRTYIVFLLEVRRTSDNELLGATLVHEGEEIKGTFAARLEQYPATLQAAFRRSFENLARQGINNGLREVGMTVK